ncbi:uncharacterized protein E0L32_000584 [Thyridium curvatum]|uniref:Cell division control protein n=1 Tax=Thyridium curvatum TaxID=1093900 RepID=A0A507BC54_9PEZI|nr:uncharacterized protein E0L32_000584 [Thyridium curvatum]TPX14190.1 hypothetical protein E0L32_000584 [Thyridium curvatum]
MAASALGKRTRRSTDADLDLPAKRTRRQTRSFEINDENQDPNEVSPPELDSSLEDSPSKRHIDSVSPVKFPITPTTPRFRDALAKNPSTPRQRVTITGKFSKRLTPQSPLTPTSCQTVYYQARQLFSRSSDPGQLIGRDEERAKLQTFLDRCSTSHPGGCLYVSGPPGTGKSAMCNEITTRLATEHGSVRKAYINCMSIKSSTDLFITLLDLLGMETAMCEEDAASSLEKVFITKKKSADVHLVVLDEVDHIMTLDLESLYRLFEWSMQKGSRLLLVGIANALDLTDRFLPRLKSRNLKPELLPFLPYTAPQIKNIITNRLKSLLPADTTTPDYTPFFHPAAIELCSRKVSSQTGDLRKAFEILRRAIDLIESETKQKYENEAKEAALQMTPSKKPLGENNNLASSPSKADRGVAASILASLKSLTVESAPRVSIGHLNKVTAAAFSNGANQRLKTLNLQQKAALCSLMALEKRNRASMSQVISGTPSKSKVTAPTIKTLFDTYCLLCKQDAILHPLSSSEFREVVGSLETLSLVTAVDGKTGSFAALQTPSKRGRKPAFISGNSDEKRVASCVGEKEMGSALEGPGSDILKSIMFGEALD